jgi:hypothetical protein
MFMVPGALDGLVIVRTVDRQLLMNFPPLVEQDNSVGRHCGCSLRNASFSSFAARGDGSYDLRQVLPRAFDA